MKRFVLLFRDLLLGCSHSWRTLAASTTLDCGSAVSFIDPQIDIHTSSIGSVLVKPGLALCG
jgi:hypothetical protein